MKYTIPFLMVILTMSFFACKKKKDNDTPAPEVQRLAASFTGMKTWRYSYTNRTSFDNNPATYSTTTGTISFVVKYVKGDTISIDGNKLWYISSEGDSSTRFVLNYKGFASHYGPTTKYSASFVHSPSGDTIFCSDTTISINNWNWNNYVTP